MTIQRRATQVIWRAATAAAVLAVLDSSTAFAQTDKYWNIPASNPAPAGTWDTSTANWNDVADGSGSQVTWAAGDRATFSAGTGATGSYTVTVGAAQSISGLTVEEGNPTFATNSLSLSNGTIINIASGSTATIGSTTLTTSAGNQVTKNGSGTLVVSGNNTGFAGEFVVAAGTVGIGNNSAFGTTAGNSTLTIHGGKLAASGANRSLSANLTTNLNGDFTVDNSLGSNQITVNGAATIRNSNRVINVDGTGILIFPNTLGEDVAGRGLTKQGSGTLQFGADATEAMTAFTGDFTILNGKVELTAAGRIGNEANQIHFVSGTLTTTGDRSITTEPISNPLSIEGNVVIATTSSAANADMNFTGTFTNTGGSILFRNDGADAAADVFDPRFSMGTTTFSLPIELNNGLVGQTRLSSFNPVGTTHAYNGVISGNGSFRRSTGGTAVFNAANTYSGGTSVTAGTLLVNNTTDSGTGSGAVSVTTGSTLGGTGIISNTVTVSSGAHIAPGVAGPATLTVGGLTLGTGAATTSFLNFEFGSPGVPAESDHLTVTLTNGLTLNGSTIDVIPLAGFGAGTYTLIDYDGTVGGAGVPSLAVGNAPVGFNYAFADNATLTAIQLVVTASSGGLDGDFDNNLMVDAADYVFWRENLSAQPNAQDLYDDWRSNFGTGIPAGPAAAFGGVAIPEPGSLVLLVLGMAAFCGRRRTR